MPLDQLNFEILLCRKCPRLVDWRERVAKQKKRAYRDWDYWGRPVPGFGDSCAGVFVIGLAPGAHGSNRTGRQFTGDASGDFLYPALYRAGFASQPNSISRKDGLTLTNLYTASVCRCAPPDNKPTLQEMVNCLPFMEREIEIIRPKVIVVLGRIAFDGFRRIYSINDHQVVFSHQAVYPISPATWLVCSYHPSRQNTQTGRLTVKMFDEVWKMVSRLLEKQ
jgi:uracil-DNA glycosylase family 4